MTPEQKTTLNFNVVTYTAFECSTNFIDGNYDASIKAADECIKLCGEFSKLSPEEGGTEAIVAKCKAQVEELEKTKIKAEAKIKGVSSLDLSDV